VWIATELGVCQRFGVRPCDGGDAWPRGGIAIKRRQRVAAAATELAFAAAALGLVVGSVALLRLVVPRQMQGLCVSARAMVESSGVSWPCGEATPGP
jgi:hypothetical protein